MSDTTLHAQLLDDYVETQLQHRHEFVHMRGENIMQPRRCIDCGKPEPVTAAERYDANRALDELDATTPINERVFR